MTETGKTRISKKRSRIIETGSRLFLRFGFRRVTVEEICREADASKMTFYKYFPNKLELFKAIMAEMVDDAYRRLDEIDAMDIPFPEKLRRVVRFKMEMLSTWSEELIAELIHADSEIENYFNTVRRDSMGRFIDFIERHQEAGDMRRMRPEFFLAAAEKLRELMDNEQLRSLYYDDLELIKELNNFVFFGILPVDEESCDRTTKKAGE